MPELHHVPFLALLPQYENTMEQFQEFESSMWAAMMGTPGAGACPYLVLRVRRGSDLLRDTLVQVRQGSVSSGAPAVCMAAGSIV